MWHYLFIYLLYRCVLENKSTTTLVTVNRLAKAPKLKRYKNKQRLCRFKCMFYFQQLHFILYGSVYTEAQVWVGTFVSQIEHRVPSFFMFFSLSLCILVFGRYRLLCS